MLNGLSREDAEHLTLNNPITLELFYDIGRGLFAVESEVVECIPVYNPYTGDEIPEQNNKILDSNQKEHIANRFSIRNLIQKTGEFFPSVFINRDILTLWNKPIQ
jgi:hypothetical protein